MNGERCTSSEVVDVLGVPIEAGAHVALVEETRDGRELGRHGVVDFIDRDWIHWTATDGHAYATRGNHVQVLSVVLSRVPPRDASAAAKAIATILAIEPNRQAHKQTKDD